jgi:hypothetical protein
MAKIQAFCGQHLIRFSLLLVTACAPLLSQAADTSPAEQLKAFSAQAGRAGDAKQGELFFNQKHGGKWSCSSCHNAPPVTQGKHAATAKPIKPLAPVANATAFTDTAKIEKWFKRNCKDVLERECTPAEKADVLSYLMGVQP